MVSEQYTAIMERIDRMGMVNNEQCATIMEKIDCINNQLECLDGFKIEMKDFMNEIASPQGTKCQKRRSNKITEYQS